MTEDDGMDVSQGSPWENTLEGASQEDRAVDELHRLLASARRRRVMSYLVTAPGNSVRFDTLVDIVVADECPGPGPGTHRDRVEVDLHHVHLPKLDSGGVIEYDSVQKTVYYERSDALESLLAVSNTIENVEDER